MKSTGCVPHYPPGPKGSIWGVRNACQSRRKKTCKSIEFEPQKHHFVRNAKRGMLVFPRELSHWALRSPPRDPLTYMHIYDVSAHLVLSNHVFYRADQNRPFQQPPGDPRRSPAPPGGPPGTPPGPGCERPDKTRRFRHMRLRFPDSVGNSPERDRSRTEKTRHFARPGRPFPVSVGDFKVGDFKYHVNYRANHDPMLQFPDSVGYHGNGPGLSPGKEATSAPKMTCFTVRFFARSHRLRAAAPYMSESSIVLTVSGGAGREANVHGKTRQFRHGGRLFPGREADFGGKTDTFLDDPRKRAAGRKLF